MPSSGYIADSFVANEQPSTAKWNELWGNDASFNSGAGFNDAIILTRHFATTGLQLPDKTLNPYKFSVYRSATQTITQGSFEVQFDTKIYDTGSNVDVITNKGRFTATIAGFYFFTSTIQMSTGADFNYQASLYKNGALAKGGILSNDHSASNIAVGVTDVLQLAANDFVEVYATTSNVGGANITGSINTTYFTGFLLSQT